MDNKIIIIYLTLFSIITIKIDAADVNMATQTPVYEAPTAIINPPGGPTIQTAQVVPLVQTTPVLQGSNVNTSNVATENLFTKSYNKIKQTFTDNPRLSLGTGIVSTAFLFAYKNSPSFKKDVDEKFNRLKQYFKNDLTLEKAAKGMFDIAAVGFVLYFFSGLWNGETERELGFRSLFAAFSFPYLYWRVLNLMDQK